MFWKKPRKSNAPSFRDPRKKFFCCFVLQCCCIERKYREINSSIQALPQLLVERYKLSCLVRTASIRHFTSSIVKWLKKSMPCGRSGSLHVISRLGSRPLWMCLCVLTYVFDQLAWPRRSYRGSRLSYGIHNLPE